VKERTILLRGATEDDLESLVRLFLELKRHHAMLEPSNPRYSVAEDRWRMLARSALEDPSTTIYVAAAGERVVGFVTLVLVDKPWGTACEIGTLIVEDAWRNRGVGKQLLRASERFAAEGGAKGMRVDVLMSNVGGRAFYEREGYAPFAVRYGKAVPQDH
jgi:ribosomal protein S18 acetylase RimI-like enzyme